MDFHGEADRWQASADEARSARDWQAAQSAYAAAIELLRDRDHARAGALSVQRGHALKELRRHEDAELAYRDALGLGAAAREVSEHLDFVVMRTGRRDPAFPPGVIEAAQGVAPPSRRLLTRWSTRALVALFLPEASLADGATLEWMRAAPTFDRLVAALISHPRFEAGNARLLNAAARRETPP